MSFLSAYIVIVIYAIIPGRTGSNSEEYESNLTQDLGPKIM